MGVWAYRVTLSARWPTLLMLKYLYNLSDERVVAHCETNPYFQYLAERPPYSGFIGDDTRRESAC